MTFLTYYEHALDVMLRHALSLNIRYSDDRTSLKSHQYFLGTSNLGETVVLLTVNNFLTQSCNHPRIKVVNKFNKSLNKWMMPLKIIQKFTNFNGCPMTVLDNFGPHLYPKKRFNEISECLTKNPEKCLALLTFLTATTGFQGFAVDIFNIAAKIANFTPSYKFRINIREPKIYFSPPNVAVYVSMYDQIKNGYSPTGLNFISSFILATTPSEYYNNYEKLWLPFDGTTWLLLLITFLSGYFVIVGLNFAPRIIRNSIIGFNITTPALNLVQVFLDNSLTKLPKTSLARFILMLFIAFCLIFRTLYQSKSFDLMTSDIRKPPPTTIQDLIERNYSIVTFAHGHERFLYEMIPNADSK